MDKLTELSNEKHRLINRIDQINYSMDKIKRGFEPFTPIKKKGKTLVYAIVEKVEIVMTMTNVYARMLDTDGRPMPQAMQIKPEDWEIANPFVLKGKNGDPDKLGDTC